MKLFITLGLLGLLCPCAMAADVAKTQPNKEAMFAEMKQKMLENIDTRIGVLQSAKTCLSAAADKAAVMKCRQEEKTAMEALRKTHKQNRKEMLEKREQKLQDQLQKVQDKKQQVEQSAKDAVGSVTK